jgi:hypothetical protein
MGVKLGLPFLGRNRVRVVNFSVLRKIFWHKREEVTGHWEKDYIMIIFMIYTSPIVTEVV